MRGVKRLLPRPSVPSGQVVGVVRVVQGWSGRGSRVCPVEAGVELLVVEVHRSLFVEVSVVAASVVALVRGEFPWGCVVGSGFVGAQVVSEASPGCRVW